MIAPHAHAKLAAALATVAFALAPASALAGDGGASLDAAPGIAVATGPDGVELRAPATALLHQRLRLSGTVPRRRAGSRVVVERRGTGGWAAVARGTARADGTFATAWRINRLGSVALRARLADAGGAAHAGAGARSLRITVYRPAWASWYGPEAGTTTACGPRLTSRTLGVAHRTLPCGTRVAVTYGGRTIVVPVIDRGPYVRGRDWDLTIAAARALGMADMGVARIGTLVLSKPAG